MASIKSLALKFFFLCCPSSIVVYAEYCHLYMKQLGFNPQQIGFTTLFGIPHLVIPLLHLLGDKFRARMAIVWISVSCMVATCLLPLLPLLISLPTCFGTGSVLYNFNETTKFTTQGTPINGSAGTITKNVTKHSSLPTESSIPWFSNLFILIAVSRSLNTLFDRIAVSLGNLATTTYLGEELANFGSYYMWSQIGGGFSIFAVSLLAWKIKIHICGDEKYGFFVAFIWGGFSLLLSMFSLPWFKFEYNNKDAISWTDLKPVLFNGHYVFMFLLVLYIGIDMSFQIFWEFWYLDELLASPLIMGLAGLIRRPLLAISMLMSCKVLNKIGDLNTVCVALLLYAMSFLALSFTRMPWLVLSIDLFQAAAGGLSYSACVVHMSKAGSKHCSGIIIGKSITCNFSTAKQCIFLWYVLTEAQYRRRPVGPLSIKKCPQFYWLPK